MRESLSAGGVVVNSENKVLIANQNHKSWSFPKGHVEPDEQVYDAALREIKEETGVEELEFIKILGDYKRFAMGANNEPDMDELKHIYLYLFTTLQHELSPHDPNNPEARWVSITEALDLLTNDDDLEFFESITPEIVEFIKSRQDQITSE